MREVISQVAHYNQLGVQATEPQVRIIFLIAQTELYF